jgi:RHS repeat-associated protein
MMTDSSGNVIGEQGHYPFGESWYENNTTTKWMFTTYERDSESSNDYATFRYNIGRLGRFASPDPLAGSVANPQSLNRYAYVLNDPVNFVDPLGLAGELTCTIEDEVELCTGSDGTTIIVQAEPPEPPPPPAPDPGFYSGGGSPVAPDPGPGGRGDFGGGGGVGGVGEKIARAKAVVKAVLNGNNDCSKFFNSNSPAVEVSAAAAKGTALEGLVPTTAGEFFASDTIQATGALPSGQSLPPGVAAYTYEFAGAAATIYVNSESNSLFNASGPSPGLTFVLPDNLAGGSLGADSVFLLHELGHTLGTIPPDAGSQARSRVNTQTIVEHCLKAIQAVIEGM